LLKSQRPQVLSEFGGYVYKEKSHSFNRDKTYGYKLFDRQEDFMDALERLYREGVLEAKKKGLSAAIYTQLSDVEDETNGLMTYDRKICKVDEKRMNLLSRALREE
ncbi:MAG: glycoside hydrolase family 2, partial [Firmicutes bacterium]|nr:glycoside hydrolase family 2 [Bacillota bacterium]